MIQIRTYVDERGRPRAELAPPHELVGWFLETEVGFDLLLAQRLMADIDAVIETSAPRTGHAQQSRYWLDAEGARLRYREIDPPQEVELSLMALRFALDRWRALLHTL